MIYPSLGCKSMVLYILTWTPQLNLLLTVCSAIGSKIFLSSLLLHRILHLISWVHLLLDWFHDPISIVPVVSQISSSWTNVWKVKCILEGLLSSSNLVSFQFPVSLYSMILLLIFSWFWTRCLDELFYMILDIL